MTFANPLTAKLAAFLEEIGLDVRAGTVEGEIALPGIDIEHGVLVVDEGKLAHPGDLLHEAGHLAVVEPERRAEFHHDVGKDGGEEMAAIAWSYAAALHLKIDPALVFHAEGYKGESEMILTNFADGRYFGVPYLAWAGLSIEPVRARREPGLVPYPVMIGWLREG
jgi:hypothetical protein